MGEDIGNRLYQVHKEREKRKEAYQIAVQIKDQSRREVSKVALKSHQMAHDKLVRDIEKILDYVDYD